jgi:hypothetical protein
MIEQMDAPSSDDGIVEQVVTPPVTPQPAQPSSSQPAEPAVQPQAAPAQPAAPVTPAQPQAPQAPVVVQPQVPQQPVVQQQPVAQAGQGAPQAPVQGNELEQLRQGMEQQRENFVKAAAQSYLPTFSDADIEAIQGTDLNVAKQTMANMAARLHADIAQNILGMVASQVPGMIMRAQVVQAQHQRSADEFYNEFPDLKAHDVTVKQIAGALRAQHPQMPLEQFKPMLVAMARVATGSQVQAVQQPQQVPQQPIRQAPFVPAASGRSGTPAAQPKLDQWGFLSEIIEADERGAFER